MQANACEKYLVVFNKGNLNRQADREINIEIYTHRKLFRYRGDVGR
jgi:hypothetical protein